MFECENGGIETGVVGQSVRVCTHPYRSALVCVKKKKKGEMREKVPGLTVQSNRG